MVKRAVPSMAAHHRVNGPDTGRNSEGRRIKKKKKKGKVVYIWFHFETAWAKYYCRDVILHASGKSRTWVTVRC